MIVITKITVITLMIILSPCTCCEQLQYTVINNTNYEKKSLSITNTYRIR